MAIGSYNSSSINVDVTGGVSISPFSSIEVIPRPIIFKDDSGNEDMNVNGSSTNKIYTISPSTNKIWYCEYITLSIDDGGSPNPNKYGDLNELQNGTLIELYYGSNAHTIQNLKNNSDILHTFIFSVPIIDDKFMSFNEFYVGNLIFKILIPLKNSRGDKLQVTVRDNLTGLNYHKMSAFFYEIDET